MTDPETLAIQYQTHVKRHEKSMLRVIGLWMEMTDKFYQFRVLGVNSAWLEAWEAGDKLNREFANLLEAYAEIYTDMGQLWDAVIGKGQHENTSDTGNTPD